jgi:hypothetical protein
MDFRAHIVEVVSDSILPMSGKMEITRRVCPLVSQAQLDQEALPILAADYRLSGAGAAMID